MSWDIHVQDFPRAAKEIKDIPNSFLPESIGQRSAIIAGICQVAPSADFSDPSWGSIRGENWSIEVNIGDGEECEGFMLHVRGGDEAAGVVAAILEKLNLRGFDCQTGEFFQAGSRSLESFQEWRAYRDRVVGDGGA
jgi:hypothetical protein